MKNLKIGKKLFVAFGLVMLLFVGSIAVGISCMNTVGYYFDYFYNQSHAVVVSQLDMRRAFQSAVKNILRTVVTNDAGEMESLIAQAQTDLAAVQDGLVVLNQKFTGDATLVPGFTEKMNASIPYKEQIYELARAQKNDEAMLIYNNNYAPLLVEAQDYLEKIGEDVTLRAADLYQKGAATEAGAVVALWCVGGIGLLLIILLCIYITRSLTRPIKEIESAAQAMARGELNHPILYQSKDELGSLATSMRTTTSGMQRIVADIGYLLGEIGAGNFTAKSRAAENYVGDFAPILTSMRDIVTSLSTTLSQINQAADQVSSGSDQVSGGAQALSQGATEQASSVEELAATIGEISAQVRTNASSAEQANAMAASVGTEMQESNLQMERMISAMGEISESSREIGKIIKTIEDIAFQTNILALNAAVEAARAGAAGKGFAVVADEVRNLASKSAEASKNTSALIEHSIKAVENGTQIAGHTAQSLTKAVAGAADVTHTIDRISLASKEQAMSIGQVTTGMDQISSVVQTNSATAEESAAASEELSSQAQLLKTLVGKFILLESSGASMAQLTYEQIPDEPQENHDGGKY